MSCKLIGTFLGIHLTCNDQIAVCQLSKVFMLLEQTRVGSALEGKEGDTERKTVNGQHTALIRQSSSGESLDQRPSDHGEDTPAF
jgi:hypothetical protein